MFTLNLILPTFPFLAILILAFTKKDFFTAFISALTIIAILVIPDKVFNINGVLFVIIFSFIILTIGKLVVFFNNSK
jgi:hypothetical protein